MIFADCISADSCIHTHKQLCNMLTVKPLKLILFSTCDWNRGGPCDRGGAAEGGQTSAPVEENPSAAIQALQPCRGTRTGHCISTHIQSAHTYSQQPCSTCVCGMHMCKEISHAPDYFSNVLLVRSHADAAGAGTATTQMQTISLLSLNKLLHLDIWPAVVYYKHMPMTSKAT